MRKNLHIYEEVLYDAVRKIWYKLTGIKATLLTFDDLTLMLDSITIHPSRRLTFRFVDGNRKMVRITR